MVGCQYDKGQTSFFTTAPIASVGELKGKAVGVIEIRRVFRFRGAPRSEESIGSQPIKDVALIQLGGTREIIAGMQNNLVQGGSISLPLTLQARKLGFRELLTTETDRPCRSTMAASSSNIRFLKSNREELKRVLRATIAAYDLAIQPSRHWPRRHHRQIHPHHRCAKPWTRPTKKTLKTMPCASHTFRAAGLRSIVDFPEPKAAAEVKKLALDRMYDNSLLQEIQKETTK